MTDFYLIFGYTLGTYYVGAGLYEGGANFASGLGLWGGTDHKLPDQYSNGSNSAPTATHPPDVLIKRSGQSGIVRVGIGELNPLTTLHVGGTFSASGTKNFDIPSCDPERPNHRIRHTCWEGDHLQGGLLYSRRITAPKAGIVDIFMDSYFKFLVNDVQIFVNGFKHMGMGWGEQDQLDGNVLHIHVSRGGEYNLLISGIRDDPDSKKETPTSAHYVPEPPQTQNASPL